MDKFVIRTPRNSPSSSPTKKKLNFKQTTIESLQGVVVIEELERAKVVLERSDTSTDLKVDTLRHLKRKRPAKEILLKTGVGKTVHKMCKNKESAIAAEAKEVYRVWKEHILSKVNRPNLEVKCDLKTQNFRNTARKMLLDALSKKSDQQEGQRTNNSDRKCEKENSESKQSSNSSDKCEVNSSKSKEIHNKEYDTDNSRGRNKDTKKSKGKSKADDNSFDSLEVLAEYIEREVFQTTRRLVSNSYRRTIRKLVFGLKHNDELRSSVTSASLSVGELVKDQIQK